MITDVETVLKEIRERVIAEHGTALSPPAVSSAPEAVELSLQTDNGRLDSLERLSAQLAVTARAWDRLPPLVSNRRGALARLEIWIKKICRPLTRWFTWEQINFNAATHHALLDALAALKAHEEDLRALHRLQAAQVDQLRTEMKEHLAHVDATLQRYSRMMSDLAAEMRKGHQDLTREIHQRFPEMAASMNDRLQKLERDLDARVAELSRDLREEQRVCFKQLSLETNEAAVLEDRGRRALESRVERLEAAVQQGDKK